MHGFTQEVPNLSGVELSLPVASVSPATNAAVEVHAAIVGAGTGLPWQRSQKVCASCTSRTEQQHACLCVCMYIKKSFQVGAVALTNATAAGALVQVPLDLDWVVSQAEEAGNITLNGWAIDLVLSVMTRTDGSKVNVTLFDDRRGVPFLLLTHNAW